MRMVDCHPSIKLQSRSRRVHLKRYRSVSTWHDMHGRIDDKGDERSSAHYELDAERALMRALDALGMSPAARARLGVDLARSASLLDQAAAMRAAGDRLRQRADQIAIDAMAQDETHAEASPPAPGAVAQEGSDSVPTEAHSERQEAGE